MCQWCNPPYERRAHQPLDEQIDLLELQTIALVARVKERFTRLQRSDAALGVYIIRKTNKEQR